MPSELRQQQEPMLLLKLHQNLQTNNHSVIVPLRPKQRTGRPQLTFVTLENPICIRKDLCKYPAHLPDNCLVRGEIFIAEHDLTRIASWRHARLSLSSWVVHSAGCAWSQQQTIKPQTKLRFYDIHASMYIRLADFGPLFCKHESRSMHECSFKHNEQGNIECIGGSTPESIHTTVMYPT